MCGLRGHAALWSVLKVILVALVVESPADGGGQRATSGRSATRAAEPAPAPTEVARQGFIAGVQRICDLSNWSGLSDQDASRQSAIAAQVSMLFRFSDMSCRSRRSRTAGVCVLRERCAVLTAGRPGDCRQQLPAGARPAQPRLRGYSYPARTSTASRLTCTSTTVRVRYGAVRYGSPCTNTLASCVGFVCQHPSLQYGTRSKYPSLVCVPILWYSSYRPLRVDPSKQDSTVQYRTGLYCR